MIVRPQATPSGRRHVSRVAVALAVSAVAAFGASTARADFIPAPDDPAEQLTMSTMSVQYKLGQRVLKKGMHGRDVMALQRILIRRKYRIVADGAFGPKTALAVKYVQRRAHLTIDGIVGPRTFAVLGIRFVRSTPVPPVTPPPTGKYPLAGPNAAKAKYLKAFPVAGPHTYFNDYGAPRPQGSHQGNDIMAARGVPVRAVAAGTIWKANRVESGLGGVYVWLEDARGTDYYFAHLNAIPSGIVVGSKVTVGQVIGYVGNTGDARYGATHLHFEIRPAGVGPVNPYTDLLAVDPYPPVRN